MDRQTDRRHYSVTDIDITQLDQHNVTLGPTLPD